MRKMLIATVSAMALFSLGAVAQDTTGTDTQAPAATTETPPPADAAAAGGATTTAPDAAAPDATATTDAAPAAPAPDATATTDAAPAETTPAPDATTTTEAAPDATTPAPDATTTTDAAPAVEEPMVEDEAATEAADAETMMPDTHQSAEAVIGSNIMSPEGDEIGEISDLIFKEDDKTIEMVVVDVGGFLGMGAKPVAIPFADLTYEEGDGGWVVSTTAEQLDALPEFTYPEEELPPAATDPGLAPAPAPQ